MTEVIPVERRNVTVRGIVQGVGFRPFVFALARRHALTGTVWNDAEGVRLEIEGRSDALDAFLHDLTAAPPPLARIEDVSWRPLLVRGDTEFLIQVSRAGSRRETLVSPDVAPCIQCLAELFDRTDRRYRYPFVNCTNCGPRFTITRGVPYDRAATTMAGFAMCALCQREYDDPTNRRFHAQPNACPVCGPRVQLLGRSGEAIAHTSTDSVQAAAELMRSGAVLAVKGLGGYHLACDPWNGKAVTALRRRKVRQDKPFALMARDLEQARWLCDVSPEEAELLAAPSRPIVLLARRDREGGADPVHEEVAPRQHTLGVMLAYTPLHHILLHDTGRPLVMTSGNRSDEPIAYRDEEAVEQLDHIADFFLVHDRPIHMRCDDTVARHTISGASVIRRSRGYAPAPLPLPYPMERSVLACGAQLKNTFCVTRHRRAFLSHHIGDLENYHTLRSYKEGIAHYCRLFDLEPEILAYDLHPEYLSTKYAREQEEEGMAAVGVQHHHAHVAACLADNGCLAEEEVIGIALDGTGYGTDGALWGGEFFEGSVRGGFVRRVHLAYVPMPGGSATIRQPWRMAVSYLLSTYSADEIASLPLEFVRTIGEHKIHLMEQMVRGNLNVALTSSAGRLFDAVAALVSVPGSLQTTYEGQAAVELELAACGTGGGRYPFHLRPEAEGWIVETRELVEAVLRDVLAGRSVAEMSARFHRTVAQIVVQSCLEIRKQGGPDAVALSGGTFQNMRLLNDVVTLLKESGFRLYTHRHTPTNDGGLSLGQAILADSVFRTWNG